MNFDRLKFEIDMDTYLTYTNSVFPISLLNVEEGWRVLDIGCGWGRDVRILEGLYGANAVGVDIKKYNNEKMILADARFLCFKENSFDAIICILALPYVQEEDKALREIRRVLKRDGKLLLVLFNNSLSNIKNKISPKEYYEKIHDSEKTKSMLENFDFEVNEIHFANFGFPLLNRLPKFYKIVFKYENRLSKLRIAKWIAKRIVVIAKNLK